MLKFTEIKINKKNHSIQCRHCHRTYLCRCRLSESECDPAGI